MVTGPPPTPPMERLAVILSVLSQPVGREVPVDELLDRVTYGSERVQDRRDQLRRDVRNLEALGWVIHNVGAAGEGARYRLVAVDNRLRVMLTPEQRFALLRAARLTRLPDLVAGLDDGAGLPPTADDAAVLGFDVPGTGVLEQVRWAAARRCRVRFGYKGRRRVAHPHAVHLRPAGWYLTAREDGDDVVKTFVLDRMSDVELDPPGSADPPTSTPARPQLDPISWLVDPPLDAVVETTVDHRPRVETMLGPATSAGAGTDADTVVLTIPVTSRQAFRSRLYQLGTRVRLVGPPELCDEVRVELTAMARTGGAP